MEIGAVTFSQAITSPDTHMFVPGVGYIDVRSSLALKPGGMLGNCNPPPNTSDQSWHALKTPEGNCITFQWLCRQRLWMRLDIGARRLAFSPDYLSSFGWNYHGPAENRHG